MTGSHFTGQCCSSAVHGGRQQLQARVHHLKALPTCSLGYMLVRLHCASHPCVDVERGRTGCSASRRLEKARLLGRVAYSPKLRMKIKWHCTVVEAARLNSHLSIQAYNFTNLQRQRFAPRSTSLRCMQLVDYYKCFSNSTQ